MENKSEKIKLQLKAFHWDLYIELYKISEECKTKKVRVFVSEFKNTLQRNEQTIKKRLAVLRKHKIIKIKQISNGAMLITLRIPCLKDVKKVFRQK